MSAPESSPAIRQLAPEMGSAERQTFDTQPPSIVEKAAVPEGIAEVAFALQEILLFRIGESRRTLTIVPQVMAELTAADHT